MSELKIKTWSMPAADLGAENPFPPLSSNQELHNAQSVDPAVPVEIRQNMTYGHVPNILPYAVQDGYNRERKPRDFRVAVLENDILNVSSDAGGWFPMGVGWYQKSLTLYPEWRGKKIFIEFEGVYMNARIWLNHHFLGRHPYGWLHRFPT